MAARYPDLCSGILTAPGSNLGEAASVSRGAVAIKISASIQAFAGAVIVRKPCWERKTAQARARKHIVNDAALSRGGMLGAAPRRQRRPGYEPRKPTMTYRVVSNLAGTALADPQAKEFLPHLVCSWTLDPASRRLSCAWAPPVDGWIATRNLSRGIALARSRVS
jgi:hypothetical protein